MIMMNARMDGMSTTDRAGENVSGQKKIHETAPTTTATVM